jgi:hypothetical protein
MIIQDYQRGRLPHYVPPPELKTDDTVTNPDADKVQVLPQDLDAIVPQNMDLDNPEDDDEGKPSAEEDGVAGEDAPEKKGPTQAAAELIGAGNWED